MALLFGNEHIAVVDESLHVAEELVNDFFSVTRMLWIRNPYEVCTLQEIDKTIFDSNDKVFAHLLIYERPFYDKKSGGDRRNWLYRICLNDTAIMEMTDYGARDKLFPFLVYVLTHELAHIVRFGRYDCCFDVYDRLDEERRVHKITRDILSKRTISGLEPVIEFFRSCIEHIDSKARKEDCYAYL